MTLVDMAIAETYFATVHLSNTINYIPTYVHSIIMTSCGGATVSPNFTLQKYESACYCVRIESRYRYGGYVAVAVAAAAAARSLPLHPIHHHYLFLFYLLSELQQVNSKNTSSSLVEVKMNSAKDTRQGEIMRNGNGNGNGSV